MTAVTALLESFRQRIKYALQPVSFPEPVHVVRQHSKIMERYDVAPQIPTKIELGALANKAKTLWDSQGSKGLLALSKSEVGNLPWVLYYGEPPQIASQAELVQHILRLLEPRARTNILKLIHAYLLFFDPTLPGTEVIRKFLVRSLAQYQGRNPRVRRWRERASLVFAPDGPRHAAGWILTSEKETAALLSEDLGLEGDLATGAFVKALTRTCLTMVEKTFPNGLGKALNLLETPGIPPRARFKEMLPEAATKLISRAGPEANQEIQDRLRSFFLKHMDDPRLPGGRVWWKDVSPEAQRIFAQWISKRDLEFFFSIVDRTAVDRQWAYRRRFWEAYLPYIENTWVALGPRARALVDSPQMRAHMEERHFAILSGVEGNQSVFFVQMGGYIFLEWSHSGACRVWDQQTCGFELGQPKYSGSELRADNYVHYQRHIGPWQEKLAQWILLRTGIRPAKPYL
ncbi:MAG: hypothetical protein D9V47_02930 [Clostridia bacterium]|nr:MAG: hypothetical protein D9V47_02930 [Clostridia bacterium]